MTDVRYDQGTFTYALMFGLLCMPLTHPAPPKGTVELADNPLSRYIDYSDEGHATFDNYNNLSTEPYARFLMRQGPWRAVNQATIAEPRTDLGRKLLKHRKAALAGGMRLLSEEEISSVLKEIRGERT